MRCHIFRLEGDKCYVVPLLAVLEEAAEAFKTWSRTTPDQRASRLCAAALDLRSDHDERANEQDEQYERRKSDLNDDGADVVAVKDEEGNAGPANRKQCLMSRARSISI